MDMGQQGQSWATMPDLGSAGLVSPEGGSEILSPARSSIEADMAKRRLSDHFGKSPSIAGAA